jgi:hypothetical protein
MSAVKGMRNVIVLLGLCLSGNAIGAVTEYHITDVTPSSFTVVFAGTGTVVAPGIKVYSDAAGTAELTLPFDIISTAQHHQNGLSAIRLNSLSSASTYYVEFTDDIGVAPYFPAGDPVLVTTSLLAPTDPGALVSNDLIKLDIYKPDQVTSLAGAIVLLSIPAVSSYPVSSFVAVNGFAYVDANNLLKGDAAIHLLQGGNNIEVKVYRGLLCAGSVDHLQVFYRKAGDDSLDGAQVNLANRCNAIDTVCDDQTNVLDVQFVLNALNSTPAECRFTTELDVVQDQVINVLDVQQILNFF